MSVGFATVHPQVEDVLRTVGVTPEMVTQGVGAAAASAGTHAMTGTFQGRNFGRCVDLSWKWPWNRENFDHCLAGGLFPFRRQPPQWGGLRHFHCVYLPPLTGETREWPGWVRVQVEDILHGRNGLVSHLPLDQFGADEAQRSMLSAVLGGRDRLLRVGVSEMRQDVYAYLEEGIVRCEFRPLVEGLGGHVLYEPGRPLSIGRDDHETVVPDEWNCSQEGLYTRCDLRPVAEWLGKRVEFDHSAMKVILG